MIRNLMIDSGIYTPVFSTYDNLKLEVLKANIQVLPKSKMRVMSNNNKEILMVYRDFYEQVINEGTRFLNTSNLETDVYWINRIGNEIPCGYYHVANATTLCNNRFYELPKDVEEYLEDMNKTEEHCWCSYDYFNKKYNICLKNSNYIKSVIEFNEFVLENGLGPFEKIQLVSRYGSLEKKLYPMLTKRK